MGSVTARVRFQAERQAEPRNQEHRQRDQHSPSEGTERLFVPVSFCREFIFQGRHGVVSGSMTQGKTKRRAERANCRFDSRLGRLPAIFAMRMPECHPAGEK